MAQQNRKSAPEKVGHHWLYVGLILLIALVLRVWLAFDMPWRQDEIVYVDWLGQWFADHLLAYVTQWQHNFYPPQSPVFANPPLAMWLISIGITVGRLFDWPLLFAARAVIVLIGMISLLTFYLFIRRFFNQRVALWGLLFTSFLPLVATNHASAFLDTPLSLIVIAIIWQFFSILQAKKVKTSQIFWLSLLTSLGLLIKFSMVLILATISLAVLIKLIRQKEWLKADIQIITTLLVPPLLWAGLRDPQHIMEVINFFSTKYALVYPWPGQSASYLLYLIHDVPTILLFLCVIAVSYVAKKYKIKKGDGSNLIMWLLLLSVLGLLNLRVFAPTSYSYQLIPIIPLLMTVAAWTLDRMSLSTSSGPIVAKLCLGLFGLEIVFLNLSQPLHYYSLSQTALAQLTQITKLVPSGTGSEDLPRLADYIQNKLPANARIAAVYNDWTLRKYILPTQSVTSLFPNENIAAATSRGASYIVASTYFVPRTSPLAKTLNGLVPIEEITVGDHTLTRVFAVNRQTTKVSPIALDANWQSLLKNSRILDLSAAPNIISVQLEFDYDTANPVRFAAFTTKERISIPPGTSGIALRLYGEGRSKNIYLDLLEDNSDNYIRSTIPLDWQGWQTVEIPFTSFKKVTFNKDTDSTDFSQPRKLRLSVDSADSPTVSFKLSDLEFVQ